MIYFPKTPEENWALTQWLVERIPDVALGQYRCMAIYRGGKIAAVAGYSNYRTVDIEITFAADDPRWATRQTLTWIFSYPFVQLKTQRITAMVRKSNRRCRKLLKGVGFAEEGAHRHAGPNKETVFSYGMVRDDFEKRYLNVVLQEKPPSTATGT